MKSLFQFFLLLSLLAGSRAYCDEGQAGISRAGGITDFHLLYPADSNSFHKVQILSEKVAIQIYRGFAVVKTEYRMRNTTGDSFVIKVGYPVNSSFSREKNSVVSSIFFDQLYALKSYTNGRENMVARVPVDSTHPMDDNNWYVWADTFKAKDTCVMSVYFIVNTNNAEVTEGYKHDANNAFLYLMEMGATLQQPIGSGEIKIELMDNLKLGDIRGFLPTSVFKIDDDKNILIWKFNNLLPTADDNVVIVYTPNIAGFDFSYVSQRRLALFGSIEAFFAQKEDDLNLAPHTFDSPYKVRKTNWKSIAWLGMFAAGSIFGLILLVWLIKSLFRYLANQRHSGGTEI